MTPIINPWWFYFADVCNTVDVCLEIAAIALFIVLFMCFMAWLFDNFRFDVETERAIKKLIIVLVIVSVPLFLVPSKDTVYKMIAASVVTENNIQTVQDNAIEFIEKFVEAMKKVKEEKE